MFRKVDVPILGIIEKHGRHVCSQCGHAEHIFGSAGGERVAREYGVPLLASLPLTLAIREQTDVGTPRLSRRRKPRRVASMWTLRGRYRPPWKDLAMVQCSLSPTSAFPTTERSDPRR